MCGIFVAVSSGTEGSIYGNYEPTPDQHRHLCSRGPDYLGKIVTEYNTHGVASGDDKHRVLLRAVSTVLSLRGSGVTKQPFYDKSSGSFLCWNGEAWKLGGCEVIGNDGTAIFDLLTNVPTSGKNKHAATIDVFRSIEGPFAFAYFDKPAGRLYYGRDRLGRRSLLARLCGSQDTNGQLLTLCSIADAEDGRWKEVEANGIYVLDLTDVNFSDGKDMGAATYRESWAEDKHLDIFGIARFNDSTTMPLERAPLRVDSPSVHALREHLTRSLRTRVLGVPTPPNSDGQTETRIAILFSGGLDCTILARISHDILPSQQAIDLINVAFENPRVVSNLAEDTPDIFEVCPDRITGRKSVVELKRICPGREWRFVAVNVPYREMLAHRQEVVSLMHPHNTEMDISIALALYFAARGEGHCLSGGHLLAVEYNTPARVLLSGLGADELFGGYGRHAVAFSRRGYVGLAEELHLDATRLSKRNLGRDDRVMATWGKEVRFPYLDEDLVKWAVEVPVWEKCDFDTGVGEDDLEAAKRVLRLVALTMNMTGVALEKKRAIQFGSRTAKMESGRVRGTATIAS